MGRMPESKRLVSATIAGSHSKSCTYLRKWGLQSKEITCPACHRGRRQFLNLFEATLICSYDQG